MSGRDDRFVLAVDLGTSGAKAAVVSTAGEIVDWAFEKTGLQLLEGGGAEQDPAEWWSCVLRACRRVLGKDPFVRGKIAAVCCTGQWSGTVAVDREGNHLTNAIIWMDSRGSRSIDGITGGAVKVSGYGIGKLPRWIRITGGIPCHSGKDSIAHILYIKNTMPDVYGRTYKFLEPKDYLNLRFSGRFAASYDSITLHWVTDNRNIAGVEYDQRLLRRSTLERRKLPDLFHAVDVLGPILGDVADELGLSRETKIVTGTPDVQSAVIGSGAVGDYQAHLYIGTSSWLTCHVPYKKTDLFHNIASLPAALPGRYFVADEQETAGACLAFLEGILFDGENGSGETQDVGDMYDYFERCATKVEAGSGGVIFTPWLYGERTPVEDHSVRAAFSNLSIGTSREHLVRAVYEGVACNTRWLLHYVEKFIGKRLDPINFIGGGAESDIWCQIHADVLDRTIRQVSQPRLANLRGAALLALISLGYTDVDDIASRIAIRRVYKPDPSNRRVYDDLHRTFLEIYRKNRRIYRRLKAGRTLKGEDT